MINNIHNRLGYIRSDIELLMLKLKQETDLDSLLCIGAELQGLGRRVMEIAGERIAKEECRGGYDL
jgi:hypothetical protein